MISKYKIITNRILKALIDMEAQQQSRLSELRKYDGLLLKEKKRANGRAYYTVYNAGSSGLMARYKYAGNSRNEDVRRIREYHHLEKSLAVLGKDIGLLKMILNQIEEVETSAVNRMLPAVYRSEELQQARVANRKAAEWKRRAEEFKAGFPVYRPEELTVKTDDGTYVRSKSEGMIYNLLLRLGITFVYELPLRTKVRTFYPDFSILSEVDYRSVILIEHQGMMGLEEYRERFKNRVYDYLRAGYVQGINIFYTFDMADGGIDTDPILDIISLKIRPAPVSTS